MDDVIEPTPPPAAIPPSRPPGGTDPPGVSPDPSHERHEHLSMIARGGLLNLLGAAAGGILNFLLVVLVTRGLGAVQAGAFFVAVALFSVLGKTLELGADTGLVRAISRDLVLCRAHDARRTLLVAVIPVLLAGTLVGLVVHTFAEELAQGLAKGSAESVAPLLHILAPFLPAAPAATVLLAATRGYGTMLPTVLLDRIAKPALQPGAVLVVLAAGLGVGAVVLAWAAPIGVTAILACLWALALIRRAERAHPRGPRTPLREIGETFWRFTIPRGLAGFFQVAIAWVDTLLISALRSTRDAGIYAAATRYLMVTSLTTLAVIQVMGPKISQLIARADRPSATSVYQVSTAWLVLLTWPVNLAILLFAPVLLSLFGRGFEAGATAIAIISGATFVATSAGPVDVVLLMAGKSTWNLLNTLVALLLNVGLNLLLIPRLGIVGAGIAWAASIIANNVLPLAQTWIHLRMHPFGRGTAAAAMICATAFGVPGLALRLLMGATFPAFVLFAVGSTGLFLALVWRFRERLDLAVAWASLRQTRDRPSVDPRRRRRVGAGSTPYDAPKRRGRLT